MRSLVRLFKMWDDTRQVSLMAATAAVYVAVLLPFKIATIIPGFTEIRPGAAIPVAFGALLGPPACWGSAFGNVVADLLGGQFGPGSAFGFLGNFLLAWIPWRVSCALGLRNQAALRKKHGRAWFPGLVLRFLPGAVLGSAACALALGWGVDLLGAVPYAFLANTVFLNNLLVTTVLGPILAAILGPRVDRWDLGEPEERPVGLPRRLAGLTLVALGALGGYLVVNVLATGSLSLLPAEGSSLHAAGVAPGGAAALMLLLAGLLLL